MKKQFFMLLFVALSSLPLTSLRAMDNKQDAETKIRLQGIQAESLPQPTNLSASHGIGYTPSTIIINNNYTQPTTQQVPPTSQSTQPQGRPSAVDSSGNPPERGANQPSAERQNAPPANNGNAAPARSTWFSRLVDAGSYINDHPWRVGIGSTASSAFLYFLGSRCTPELATTYPKNYFVQLGEGLKNMEPTSAPSFWGRSLQRLCMLWLMKKGYEHLWNGISPHSYYVFHKDVKPAMILPPSVPQSGSQNQGAQQDEYRWRLFQYLLGAPDLIQRAQNIDDNRVATRNKLLQGFVCQLPWAVAAVTYPFAEPALVTIFNAMSKTHPTSYTAPINAGLKCLKSFTEYFRLCGRF